MLYVAMTRGRHANTARIYECNSEGGEYSRQGSDGTHKAARGEDREAVHLLRQILANDQQAVTAHDYAAQTPGDALPDRVRSLLHRRTAAVGQRNADYQAWQSDRREHARRAREAREQHHSRRRDRGSAYGIDF